MPFIDSTDAALQLHQTDRSSIAQHFQKVSGLIRPFPSSASV